MKKDYFVFTSSNNGGLLKMANIQEVKQILNNFDIVIFTKKESLAKNILLEKNYTDFQANTFISSVKNCQFSDWTRI